MNELKKEKLEGLDAGTSPAPEEVELNNATVPTSEEQENAGIVNEPEEVQEQESIEEVQEPSEESVHEPELGLAETSATEPTFTQSQVDEIAGKVRKETREKVTKDFFSRYGVNSAEELDDLFGNSQRFDTLKEEYTTAEKAWKQADELRNGELAQLKESVALLESGIDRDRYDDAKFILKGKGLEVTAENIANELATHPEWKKELDQPSVANGMFRKVPAQPQPGEENPEPATQMNVLGNNSLDNPNPELSERERAMKLFKV